MLVRIVFIKLLLSLPLLAQSTGTNPLTICWESDLKPPYLTLDQNNKLSGMMVTQLEAILDKQGISYRHVLLPWARCLRSLKSGDVDLTPNASYKQERTAYALYSEPAYTTELRLYFNDHQFDLKATPTTKWLSHYRIGGVQSFNYSFYEGVLDIGTKVKNREQLLEMLTLNRVDFALLQKNVVDEMSKNRKVSLTGIRNVAAPIQAKKTYHVLIRKTHPKAEQLKALIDQSL